MTDWPPPPTDLTLASDEVHVWRVDIGSPHSESSLRALLSEDERKKADGFIFEEDRVRFTVTRGTLRSLLGRYLGLEPERLLFRHGPRGKPRLDENSGEDALRFNVSHSGSLALIVLSRGREVGVDVERVRPVLDSERIAARFFPPREAAALHSLPEAARTETFFDCWTRNEAYLKARGDGLSSIENPSGTARWTSMRLNPGPGYSGAVAVEGRGWRLKCRQWTGSEGKAVA